MVFSFRNFKILRTRGQKNNSIFEKIVKIPVSYTHLDVYKRQGDQPYYFSSPQRMQSTRFSHPLSFKPHHYVLFPFMVFLKPPPAPHLSSFKVASLHFPQSLGFRPHVMQLLDYLKESACTNLTPYTNTSAFHVPVLEHFTSFVFPLLILIPHLFFSILAIW